MNYNWGLTGGWGRGESGWWALRRAPVGMSTGCCMEATLTINYIIKKSPFVEKNKINIHKWKWAQWQNLPIPLFSFLRRRVVAVKCLELFTELLESRYTYDLWIVTFLCFQEGLCNHRNNNVEFIMMFKYAVIFAFGWQIPISLPIYRFHFLIVFA